MAGYGKDGQTYKKRQTQRQNESDGYIDRQTEIWRQIERQNKEEADTETCKKTYIQTDK